MTPSVSEAIFWVAVVCCAIAELFILRLAFAARGWRRGAADAAPDGRAAESLPPVRRAAEIVWAVVPAVALAFVLAATWRAMHPVSADTRSPAAGERSSAVGRVGDARGGALR